MKEKLKKENDSYVLEKEGCMNVGARIFLNEKLLDIVEEDALNQVKNVACMPGIVGEAMAMSDMHIGYGFPIGGVAAFDEKKGCITPGGIGFDINCGVRLLSTNLTVEDIKGNIKKLLDSIFRNVPCGVGGQSDIRLDDNQIDEVLSDGAEWAVRNGYGNEDDLKFCESNGKMPGARPSKVSPRAKARGRKQLGTLGAGNHFLEIQFVDEIYDEKTAEAFNLKKGQVVVMIHCGSRGLGHQVCSDYLRMMEDKFPDIIEKLPEKDLAYAPLGSKIADDYYSAMKAAANFAWCNRHIIADRVRKAFKMILPNAELKTVYDVAHNIAKLEEHEINGEMKKVYVHRKGATRAFPPGHKEIPEDYKEFGQPVLIPGSMGTASYVLAGTEEAMKKSFGSSAHGAGRVMSRTEAKKQFNADKITAELEKQNIFVKAASWKGVSEEAPQVYKDVDEVIETITKAKLGRKIAKLRPLGVVKG